jgi:hypothetical protein
MRTERLQICKNVITSIKQYYQVFKITALYWIAKLGVDQLSIVYSIIVESLRETGGQ